MLFKSQSAISRRLAQLETEMGAPLLERIPGGVRISAAGAVMLPHAESALASLEDARRAVRSLVTADDGPVTMAIVGTLATTWITEALREFAHAHPGVDVRLSTANSNEVVDLVRRGDASIGIGYGRTTDSDLSSRVLVTEQLCVACAPDHPLARRAIESLSALSDETWFAFAERFPRAETNARFVAGLLAAAGIPADHVQVVDSLTAQKRLIEAGFGIGLLAWSNIDDEVDDGQLGVIELADPPTTDVWVTTRVHGFLSHATRTLLATLEQTARDNRATRPR